VVAWPDVSDMAFRAPLLGYNTNVRHKGKLYHIQTEDSGVDHPHVITHLFADGGRIVATRKTSYAERVGSEGLPETVKKLMQAQHKAMFIALRDGLYDEDDIAEELQSALMPEETTPAPTPVRPLEEAAAPIVPAARTASTPPAPRPRPTSTALPRVSAPAPVLPKASMAAIERAGLYRMTQAATPQVAPRSLAPPPERARTLFGGQLLSDRSLDEVILSYLAANDNES
jgi:hypothetical protein